MYIEHICFNLALAIIVILFIDQKHAGWCTAVMVVSGCIPDIDGIFSLIQSPPVFTSGIIPSMAFHLRYFHSIGILVLYVIVVAGLLTYFQRLDFRNIALFAGVGFGAHLIEDALVYNPSSAVFWPVSSQEVGIGFFSSYSRDFLGIANGEMLGIGILSLLFVLGARIFLERMEWISPLWNRNPLPMAPFLAIAKILVVFRSMFRNR
ncbi:MAG: metal-dependent hydrolase [Methanoregula sp.]|nr:metal-dependent hydrolase [Methanoregula sp.]